MLVWLVDLSVIVAIALGQALNPDDLITLVLRRRVQRVVDRRFDRARYDAELTSAAFSERLRNEVDIQAVARELDTTVRRAMAPGGVGIWLRQARR